MVGQAWGVLEIPAVGKLRAHVEADAGGTPRMVVAVGLMEVRFVVPHALLSVETVHATDRLAGAANAWHEAIHEFAAAQRVIPASTGPPVRSTESMSIRPSRFLGGASC